MARSIPNANSYLTLQAWELQHLGKAGPNERQFSVLCGDNPPTITDGYGKWAVIDRPLRQGVSIPQGFNPARVKVELRFGVWDGRFGNKGWDVSTTAAEAVEQDIDDLHWMAGGNALGGPSPVVYMDAYTMTQNGLARTDLVPRQYHGVPWETLVSVGVYAAVCALAVPPEDVAKRIDPVGPPVWVPPDEI